MTIWLKQHGASVLIGIALAILPMLFFVYIGVSWKPLDPHDHLIQNGLAYFFLVLFSYYNYTVFVPRWFLNKLYSRYFFITTGCILGAVYLPYRTEQWVFFYPPASHTAQAWIRQLFWAEMMMERQHRKPLGLSEDDVRSSFGPPAGVEGFRSRDDFGPGALRGPLNGQSMSVILPAKLAIFFLLGSVSSLISILIQATNRLRRVETDQLQAELWQLKAQIQPHFLFNTLNSIYSLAIRNDPRTADTIVQLSEFLRYIIGDANRDYVPLATELNYIRNYIGLQKARLRDAVHVDYRLDRVVKDLPIAPLILFSFIENAFKYGVNPEEDSLIDIYIGMEDNRLCLRVSNNKVQVSNLEESTGIGLTNTRERLRLIYPGAHELTIQDADQYFRVILLLTLT